MVVGFPLSESRSFMSISSCLPKLNLTSRGSHSSERGSHSSEELPKHSASTGSFSSISEEQKTFKSYLAKMLQSISDCLSAIVDGLAKFGCKLFAERNVADDIYEECNAQPDLLNHLTLTQVHTTALCFFDRVGKEDCPADFSTPDPLRPKQIVALKGAAAAYFRQGSWTSLQRQALFETLEIMLFSQSVTFSYQGRFLYSPFRHSAPPKIISPAEQGGDNFVQNKPTMRQISSDCGGRCLSFGQFKAKLSDLFLGEDGQTDEATLKKLYVFLTALSMSPDFVPSPEADSWAQRVLDGLRRLQPGEQPWSDSQKMIGAAMQSKTMAQNSTAQERLNLSSNTLWRDLTSQGTGKPFHVRALFLREQLFPEGETTLSLEVCFARHLKLVELGVMSMRAVINAFSTAQHKQIQSAFQNMDLPSELFSSRRIYEIYKQEEQRTHK